MKKIKIDCPYVIKPFSKHKEMKSDELELIYSSKNDSPFDKISEVNISRADWFNSNDMSRQWVKKFFKYFTEDILELYSEIGFDGFRVNEIWFQQYYKESEHGWHSHSGNFTNVYYLELPDGSPKTEILDPYSRKNKISINASEGDLVAFPSFVLHRAPVNNLDLRKTIISYNIDSFYSNQLYEKEKNDAIF